MTRRLGRVRLLAALATAVLTTVGLTVAGPVAAASAATKAPSTPRPCSRGYVALSFDDGPTDLTPQYVKALYDAGLVKATFFDIGANAQQHPDYVKLEAANGDWIGNHTYDHPFLDQLGEPAAFNELLGTNQILQSMTGRAPTLFRPPYGRTNAQIAADAHTLGMTQVLWTVDSFDYTGITTDQIVANALTVKPGGIILMHDGYTTTLAAIPRIVDGLAQRGLCAGRIVPTTKPVTAWPGTVFYATAARW